MKDTREERARRRASWPGEVVAIQTPAQLDTAEARVASMERLALDAMAARGEPLPDYTRGTMPGRVLHRP